MLVFVFHTTDDRCSVIPSVGNATADTEIAKVGTLVMYHCNTGYQFPGGTSTAGIYCDRDSQSWNVSLPDCIGRNFLNNVLCPFLLLSFPVLQVVCYFSNCYFYRYDNQSVTYCTGVKLVT